MDKGDDSSTQHMSRGPSKPISSTASCKISIKEWVSGPRDIIRYSISLTNYEFSSTIEIFEFADFSIHQNHDFGRFNIRGGMRGEHGWGGYGGQSANNKEQLAKIIEKLDQGSWIKYQVSSIQYQGSRILDLVLA